LVPNLVVVRLLPEFEDPIRVSLDAFEEFLLRENSELAVAPSDTSFLGLLLFELLPLLGAERLHQALNFVLVGLVLEPPYLLIQIHLEVLINFAEPPRVVQIFQVA